MKAQERNGELKSLSTLRIVSLIVLAMAEAFLFGSVMDGWPAIEYVLRSDGVYSNLCSNITPSSGRLTWHADGMNIMPVRHKKEPDNDALMVSCPDQDSMLNTAYLMSNLIGQGSALLWGYFFDRFGLRISRLFTTVCFVSGVLMMSFKNLALSFLIFPSTLLIAISDTLMTISTTHVALLAGSRQAMCVAIISGCLDVSAMMATFMQMAYDSGISRTSCVYGYTCMFVIHILNTIFLTPEYKVYNEKTEEMKIRECSRIETDNLLDHSELSNEVIKMYGIQSEEIDAENNEVILKPFWKYAISPLYILHTLWLTVMELRFLFMLGSFDSWLNVLTNNNTNEVSQVMTIFGNLHFVILLLTPAVGAISDIQVAKALKETVESEKEGLLSKPDNDIKRAFPIVSGLIMSTVSAVALSISSLFWTKSAAYASSVFAISLKGTMYASHFAFVQNVYPSEHHGKAYGAAMAVASLIDIVEQPLFRWAEASMPPFQGAHVTLLVLSVVIMFYPAFILIKNKRCI